MSEPPPTSASPPVAAPEPAPVEGEGWPETDRRRPAGSTFWGWFRQTARLWGFLGAVLLGFVLFRRVALPFVLALLVTYVLSPVLALLGRVRIARRVVPRAAWVLVVYAVLLALMGLFFTAFVPRLSGDLRRIVREAPAFWNKVRAQYVPAAAAWVETNFNVGAAATEAGPGEGAAHGGPPRVRLRTTPEGETELELTNLRLLASQAEEGKWVLEAAPRASSRPEPGLAESLNNYFDGFVAQSESRTRQVIGLGQAFLRLLLDAVTTFILVLMISAFLLVDSERILRWFRNLVPPTYFRDFDNVVRLIDKGLSGAIRGQLVICAVNGVLTWIGLLVFGVKYPLLLGLLAGVMSLIPIFGSILSSIPIVVVALASGSAGVDVLKGVAMLLWIIAIHLLEANLLNPKIMGKATRIHPVVVIFAVVAGERTYGAVGALLGVPLVSAIQAVFVYVRMKVRGELGPGALDAPAAPPPAP